MLESLWQTTLVAGFGRRQITVFGVMGPLTRTRYMLRFDLSSWLSLDLLFRAPLTSSIAVHFTLSLLLRINCMFPFRHDLFGQCGDCGRGVLL